MERVLMYCYTGKNWESTPISGRGIYDVTNKTADQAALLADLQRDHMGRNVHEKRIQFEE